MRSFAPAGLIAHFAAFSLPSAAGAASIAGTVKAADGTPIRAAFVQARHAGLKMTVSVLTDNQGRYAVENLPAGAYRLSVRSLGLKAEPKSGLELTADQSATHDFALTPAPVRWSDLTILQGLQLLPEARGKQTLFDNCLSCHGFQSKMAAFTTDEDGWRVRVEFMREAMRSSLADRAGFSDAQADDVVFYLYEAAKIVRFDPKSETFKEFALPNAKTKPYALAIATDGTIWYSSEWRDVMGRLDPATGQVAEYPMPYTDNGMRDFFLDKEGRIWFGTPPNNRVGYFYLANKQRSAEAR
jgi:cytochrome c5